MVTDFLQTVGQCNRLQIGQIVEGVITDPCDTLGDHNALNFIPMSFPGRRSPPVSISKVRNYLAATYGQGSADFIEIPQEGRDIGSRDVQNQYMFIFVSLIFGILRNIAALPGHLHYNMPLSDRQSGKLRRVLGPHIATRTGFGVLVVYRNVVQRAIGSQIDLQILAQNQGWQGRAVHHRVVHDPPAAGACHIHPFAGHIIIAQAGFQTAGDRAECHVAAEELNIHINRDDDEIALHTEYIGHGTLSLVGRVPLGSYFIDIASRLQSDAIVDTSNGFGSVISIGLAKALGRPAADMDAVTVQFKL